MTDKFLYVVDHYVPFPSSEYGGIWNVIAQDDDECFDLITAQDAEVSINNTIQIYGKTFLNPVHLNLPKVLIQV